MTDRFRNEGWRLGARSILAGLVALCAFRAVNRYDDYLLGGTLFAVAVLVVILNLYAARQWTNSD